MTAFSSLGNLALTGVDALGIEVPMAGQLPETPFVDIDSPYTQEDVALKGVKELRPVRSLMSAWSVAIFAGISLIGCSDSRPATLSHPPSTAGDDVPTLGQPVGLFANGEGFGEMKAATIFNGGDPTGLLTHVRWSSWGTSRAFGSGTSEYLGPGQYAANGQEEHAAVVAFDLGKCDGKFMYRAVEWYFPQHGQVFSPRHYEDICHGTMYVTHKVLLEAHPDRVSRHVTLRSQSSVPAPWQYQRLLSSRI